MTTNATKIERTARLRWLPLDQMKINPVAQRELNRSRVDHLVASLDLEQLGNPTVNLRDGSIFIIDGQHRIEAMRQFGFTDEKIQCWTYEGLSEVEEAEKFLQLNDVLIVAALPKYRTAITAGRDEECDIDRIVRSLDLCVSKDKVAGAIGAVGTLRRIYRRGGAAILARALRIARDAFGDSGMEAAVLDGMGHLCQRYNGDLDEARAVAALKGVHGGVDGLLGQADILRRKTGNPKGHCVAAAAVVLINRSRGRNLPSWWKDAA